MCLCLQRGEAEGGTEGGGGQIQTAQAGAVDGGVEWLTVNGGRDGKFVCG